MYDVEHLRRDAASRRKFLAVMAAAGLGLAAETLLAQSRGTSIPDGPRATVGPAGVPTEEDAEEQFGGIPGANITQQVLNFALTLEFLEADLYRQALNLASGRSLTAPLNSNPGVYRLDVGRGGLTADSAGEGFEYLRDFAYVEAAHRDFLRAALGKAATKPNAGGYKFAGPVPANIAGILRAILPLEEVGVRAYLGALPYLTDLGVARTAATIYSTEARHSAVIAYVLGIDPGPRPLRGDLAVTSQKVSQNTFEYFLQPEAVLRAARQFFA